AEDGPHGPCPDRSRPLRRSRRNHRIDGAAAHGDLGAVAPGPAGVRLGRSPRLHRGHGRRARGLPRPRGGAHGRALAAAVTMTAREALAAWLEHLAHERRASPRTLEAYGFAGNRYLAFLERHRAEALSLADLGGLTAGEIRAWLAHLRQGDHPLSPRSLSQALSAIRGFHRFLDRRLDTPNAAVGLVRGP